jgi:hypothetical protein
MELSDTCEACLRLQWERPARKITGRPPSDGVCIRGHDMYRVQDRWRCKQCMRIYYERKRLKRKASA